MSADRTPAERLRHQLVVIISNPLLRLTPGGPGLQAALAGLDAWVESIERRWSELAVEQSRLGARVRALEARSGGLSPDLEAKLHQVLEHAAVLGQAGGAIPDAARPGGARPSDQIVSYGGAE